MKSLQDKNVLIIDNSGRRECKIFERLYGFQVEYQSENIGIPRSWNIGLKKNHEWTFIVSSSMLFYQPFSHIINMLDDFKGVVFRTDHAWHCIGINKKIVDAVGYFDENFYPGYFEDCDWDHRVRMLEDQFITNNESDLAISWRNQFMHFNTPISYVMRISAGTAKIDARCQQDGAATVDGLYVNIDGVHDYFKEKWGGNKTREGWGEYKYPFNDPSKPLSYWEDNSIETLKKRYNIK